MARRSRGVRRVVSFARLARVCAARELVARPSQKRARSQALARHHHPHTAPAPMAPFFRRGVPSAPPPSGTPLRTGTLLPRRAANDTPPRAPPPRGGRPFPRLPPLDVPFPARPRVPVPSFPPTRAVSPRVDQVPRGGGQNWTLRTRGAALVLLLELVVPLAFIALMCLPRLLIADEDRAATVHRPARLDALSWSGRLPADGSGAYELVYSPSSSEEARAVLEPRRSTSRAATSTPSTLCRTRSPNFRTVSTLQISPSVRVRSRARLGLEPELHAARGARVGGGD